MLKQFINLYLGNKEQLSEDKWTACLFSKSVKNAAAQYKFNAYCSIQYSSTTIDG